MEKWTFYALVSMLFAGATSVIAKMGLAGISAEMGLAVRTVAVFALVMAFSVFAVPRAQFALLSASNLVWLGLSGVTTAVSWIFYYKAIKLGEVSTVVLIDKGSIVVALVLAYLLLEEKLTMEKAFGALLIVGWLIVIARDG